MDDFQNIISSLDNQLSAINSQEELDRLKTEYFGRQGIINKLFSQIKNLDPIKKKATGQQINELKRQVEKLISKKEVGLTHQPTIQVDITLPGKSRPRGSKHLTATAIEEINRIFGQLGFIRMSYREVEWEYFSFEALNMPADHPARDDFETFFVDAPPHSKFGKMVLTPHTSSGQIREMMRVKKPPIKMINIAKTYRPNWDASHTPMFHQFEGLCIDEGINITNLKGTIDHFAKSFFGEKREIRLRPFHFQFTEPSFEVDITCGVCSGTGLVEGDKCKLCKSGWLELGGAGMVHPNVLRAGKIDPERYSGWAFGFGVERVAMMKEGLKIDDLRVLYSGDIRFLENI